MKFLVRVSGLGGVPLDPEKRSFQEYIGTCSVKRL